MQCACEWEENRELADGVFWANEYKELLGKFKEILGKYKEILGNYKEILGK